MEDGRQFIASKTDATLQIYADKTGIQLGSIEEWKYPKPAER